MLTFINFIYILNDDTLDMKLTFMTLTDELEEVCF
jgi:hypothetical protein